MSGTAPSVVAGPASERKVSAWTHLRRLLPYVARYKGMVTLGLLMLLGMGLAGALPQLLIGIITDSLTSASRPLATLTGSARSLLHPILAWYRPMDRHAVLMYCALLAGAVAVKGMFSFWTRWILIGVSRDIEYDLRNDLLDRLLLLDPEFYVRNRTGELMSRCTNDLNGVRMVLGPGIMYSATTLSTMVLAIYFMLKLSPVLTAWVLLPVPLVAFAMYYFGRLIHRLSEKIQAALAALSARAQENLAGARVIRAYAQEESEMRNFDAPNREYVAQNILLIRSWSMFFPALQALIGFTFLIVLWAGGIMVMRDRISIGTLFAFYSFMAQLIWPMIALGWVTNIFQRGAASMGRLNYVFDAVPRIGDSFLAAAVSAQARPRPNGSSALHVDGPSSVLGEIEFRHLTFVYPTAQNGTSAAPTLQDINLHIPAGSTLAIVGPTGGGKSTLAALIARLWEAPEGTLFLDRRSIREWPLDELRRAIGVVPQETFLFTDTLRENIAFGVSEASLEDVTAAAGTASLQGDIQGFPAGYETLVGERGITLSGGQKQRTALARALLREPRILILDDALSSVDTETEEKILQGLRDVMRRRTTIMISHRCSTVRHADQIVVLRGGRTTERGTHDELLALGGYYADLYQKQLLEQELAMA